MCIGLLVDVSRHFIPITLLKRCIRAMAALKLNVLHLHLTDAHSFPVVFDDVTLSSDTLATINSVTRSVSTTSTSIFTTSSNPNTNPNPATTATTTSTFIPNTLIDGNILKLSELGIKGSFSSKKRYSKVELQDLVTYAKLYHIEIIPEIDMPAHSLSWGKVFSNLIVNCTKTAKKSSNILDVYPLNPSEPLVLIIIKEILIQISEIFPSKYLHVGGDEVYLGCWEESTSVLEYMKKHELKSTTELFRAFETEVFSIVRGLHRVPIVWQGTLDLGGMPSETKDNSNSSSGGSSGSSESNKAVVQPWKCWSGLAMRSALTAVQNDLDVVMSACWYLDFNEPWINFLTTNLLVEAEAREAENDKRTKSTSGRDKFNKDNYQSSSTTSKIAFHNHSKDRTINQTRMNPPSHSDAFRGGEGSIWTEHVDHSNFECRMWPRAAAIASQLWGQDINTFGYLEYESSTNHTENHSDSVAAGGSSSTAAGTRVYPHTHSRTQYGQAPANEIKYKNGVIADLNINATRHLYSNFVRIRYYLESLGLSSAPLTFHYIDHYKKYQNSVRVHSEQEAIVRIEQDMNAPLLLHTSPKSHLPAGTFSITAQCLGIPISMQRPMTSDRIKLAQLNVAEGSTGTRHAQMLTWLQSKAEEGVVAVGFCELNDWNKLHSDTDISKNYPVMTIRAANAGFPYSYIMTNSQPYHIGIMSVISFDIISEYGPPMFQRGVLHAYFRSIDLHILVCHLHAHSSIQREAEATSIGQMIVAPIREADPNARIAIMGDMNTLSRWDAQHHTQSKLVEFMLRNDNEVFQRFRKKFLYPPNHHHHSSDHMASASGNINSKSNPAVVTSESSTSTAQINYNPLDILMSFGFCDSCVEMCFSAQMSIDTSSSSEKDTSNSNHSQNMIKTKTKNEKNISSCYRTEYQNTRWSWSLAQNNSFSRCMQTQCSSTEPTLYNPEV